MASTVGIGIIGCGQWGFNHVRVFSQLAGCRVVVCADPDPRRRADIQRAFPRVAVTADHRDLLKDPRVDAVCVATPASTHFPVVKEVLWSRRDVLCEKPLTLHPDQSRELTALAARVKKILMVGHVFLFNPGIRKLSEYVRQGVLGQVRYAHSERTNLGPFRYDTDALWDLAAHDVSIFNHLFSASPREVSGRGHRCLSKDRNDLAFVSLVYPNNILANVHVSWLDPKKVRTITVVGDKKMACWDDLSLPSPVVLYAKRVLRGTASYASFGEFRLLSQEGSSITPKIAPAEPLKEQDLHFLTCIHRRKTPNPADGRHALEVVRTLWAIRESIRRGGRPVRL